MDEDKPASSDKKSSSKNVTSNARGSAYKLMPPLRIDDVLQKKESDDSKATRAPEARNDSASKRYPGFLLQRPIARYAEAKSAGSDEKSTIGSDVKYLETRHENSPNVDLDGPDIESIPENSYGSFS